MSGTNRVTIRQDELEFIADLVRVKLNILNTENNQLDTVDKMEAHVKEYRMAQDIAERLKKATEGRSITEAINVDNTETANNY